jgi:hypothetical protein
MTHHNQTKELITWFLNLPLDESIDNKKHKVWSSNPKHHEAQLEYPKSQEELKKIIEKKEKPQDKQKAQKVANLAKTKTEQERNSQTQKLPLNQLPLTLSMQPLPLR